MERIHNNEFYPSLKRLYNKISCGLAWYTFSCESELKFINDMATSILGFSSKKEFIAKKGLLVKDIIHPEDFQYVVETHKKLKHLGDHQKIQFRVICNNNIIRLIEGIITLEKAHTGNVLVHFSFNDVTDQQKKEQEYQYKSSELSTLIKSIPGGVCAMKLDESPKLLFSSEQLYSLFGMDKASLQKHIKDDFFNIFHPEDRELAIKIVEELKINKKNQNIVLRVIHKKEGYKYIDFRVSTLGSYDYDTIALVILLDVNTEKKTEAKLLNQKQLVNLVLEQSDILLWKYDIVNSRCTVKPFMEGLQSK